MVRWEGVEPNSWTFAEFYRSAADECLRAFLVSIGDQDTARELVDEAFARAWASWRTVSRHPAPKAWVVRTALRTGITGHPARPRPARRLDGVEAGQRRHRRDRQPAQGPDRAAGNAAGGRAAGQLQHPPLGALLRGIDGPLALGLVYPSTQRTG